MRPWLLLLWALAVPLFATAQSDEAARLARLRAQRAVRSLEEAAEREARTRYIIEQGVDPVVRDFERVKPRLENELRLLELDTLPVEAYLGRYFIRRNVPLALFKSLVEYYELDERYVTERNIIRDAEVVVALVPQFFVRAMGDSAVRLSDARLHGQSQGLCDDEAFFNQPNPAHCTGVVIGPDLILTARHCLDRYPAADLIALHGYAIEGRTNQTLASIPIEQTYTIREIVGVGEGVLDVALLRTTRQMTTRRVATLSSNAALTEGAPLHLIGHPSGLPLKVCRYGQVKRLAAAQFFTAELDAYRGNSGSPVFNTITHSVEGLLVGGIDDFTSAGGCRRSRTCLGANCPGETVLYARELRKWLSTLRIDGLSQTP